MKISFLGAAGTVTGSKTLIELEELSALIDCGMFQGNHEISSKNTEDLQVNLKKLDCIFITHGHLDHSGYLPVLFKNGFRGQIYCTELTSKIIKIILEDSIKVQEYNLKDKKIDELLYTEIEVTKTLEHIVVKKVNEPFMVKGKEFCFYPAGHILGAASLLLTHNNKRLCFSGDLGRADDLIHVSAQLPPNLNYLVLESTYGDREHPTTDVLLKLKEHILRIKKTGGILLIPSFAVARTQVIIKLLSDLMKDDLETELPIYVDSPMASKVTELYAENTQSLKISKEEFLDALGTCKFLNYGNDHKKFAKKKGPYILIASSGMISGGKVIKYFDMFAKHEDNTVLLIGYQGEGTIGRKIVEGEKEIKLLGHTMTVMAQVDYLEGLSAHADRSELKDLVRPSKDSLVKIFLNHGEEEATKSFKDYLETEFGEIVEIAMKNKDYQLEMGK